ncbi:MAG TPA: tetratricopeptide repeat protein, partial [Bacteroidia bacterium]|nr:tetratricopeptide repeat protein [Bacteroidia bacterium]
MDRKLEFKLLTQKTIFFLAALFFGAFAVYTQNRTGAIADFSKLTIAERIMYASYGFDMYLYKLINPSFLSTFYPYPYRFIDGTLPFIYYAAPFIAIIVVALPLYITYKFNRSYFKIAAFSYGFFIANVIFVLQLISCGAAIMADRYSYVSSIGIIFGLAYFLNEFVKRYPSLKIITIAVFLFLSSLLAYGCYQRTKVWHDAETLYKDAITKYPYRALLSYKWLGYYYYEKGDTNQAIENFSVLAQINAGDAKIYDVLGNIYVNRGDYKDALDLYEKSLHEENNVYITYVDKSIVEASLGDSADAIKDYVQAIRLNPDAEKRYAEHSFNMVQANKYKQVIGQYNVLLLLNPNNPFYYFYRAVAKFGLGQMPGAITDFTAALKFNNKDVSQVCAFNLAIACDS